MAKLSSTKIYGNLDVLSKLFVHGDIADDQDNTIWDYSNQYIPQGSLQNDTVTVAGNSVALGNSTTIDHVDLSNIGTNDHHDPSNQGWSDLGISQSDIDSTNWGDYEIQKNGTDGSGIINFKT